MVQGRICRGSTVALAFLPLALFGWGGAGASVVFGFAGRVEGETRPQWVAPELKQPMALVVELVD